MATSVFTIIFFILIMIVLGTFALAGILAAPWVPLRKKDVRRMLRLAEVKPGEQVYDLGAGDGRILIIAAKEFGANSTGFEMSVLPYFVAYTKIKLLGLKSRIKLKYCDFYRQNLSQADVICTFLSSKAMEKLKTKIAREAKPGCRIVSYAFSIKGWQPKKTDKPDQKTATVYVYQR